MRSRSLRRALLRCERRVDHAERRLASWERDLPAPRHVYVLLRRARRKLRRLRALETA